MLDEDIRNAFKRHIATGGLITAPEKLLGAVLSEVSQWLKSYEGAYRKVSRVAEAEAVRDMRKTLHKKS